MPAILWNVVADPLQGTGMVIQTNDAKASNPQGFYRVRQL
jgi:hypothetical protein